MSTENSTALSTPLDAGTAEIALIGGDLSKLTPPQRLIYYRSVCASVGLNPLTRPFDYITLNGKLTLYAKRDAADQLRSLRHVSVTRLDTQFSGDLYIVTAYAVMPDGRQDSSTGAVSIKGLAGDALANAIMKAETKAKRRVTLSICGLGMLDESEAGSIPDARPVVVDEQGEIVAAPHWYDDDEKKLAFLAQLTKWEIAASDALCYLGVTSWREVADPRAALSAIWRAHQAAATVEPPTSDAFIEAAGADHAY